MILCTFIGLIILVLSHADIKEQQTKIRSTPTIPVFHPGHGPMHPFMFHPGFHPFYYPHPYPVYNPYYQQRPPVPKGPVAMKFRGTFKGMYFFQTNIYN